MVNENKRIAIWFIFIPFALTIIGTAYYIQGNVSPFLTIDYAVFLLLAVLVGLFPIKTEDSILFLINGISLPVLVIFGLIPEIIVSSIALIILMIRSKLRIDQHYRYPLNLLMFYFLSIVSAVFYYLTVIILDQIFNVALGLLALTVYLIAHLIFNQFAIYLVDKYYYEKTKVKLFDENFKFLLYTNIFVAPLSFVLIYLFEMTGTLGIIIGAFPFVTVTIGTNFYFKSKMHNKYLKEMNHYSQELNSRKNRISVIEMFIHALIEIFPSDALSYFSIDNDTITREKVILNKQHINKVPEKFDITEKSILNQAVASNRILSFNHSKEWKRFCQNDLSYEAESALVMPIKVLDKTQGIILMTHNTRAIYDELIVSLIEVFHKYFSIALDNAFHYEQLEESSQKDYLTELPNLKGLSKQLHTLKEVKEISQMSLIVLDLDYFKVVNDTHGHQAGNEVLKSLGKRLRKNLNEDIYVARYGGEEFIILLPEYGLDAAFVIAEEVRQLIADKPFKISDSMQSDMKEKIAITASLGLATCSDHCTDIEELIHLADRAMYIGSKQKGRNRVTVAQKGS